jgi:glycine C-acetyltransferase
MSQKIYKLLDKAIDNLQAAGLFKPEFVLDGKRAPKLEVAGEKILNLTSTDYLNLAQNAEVKRAASAALQEFGIGLGSSRAISGTQEVHHLLEDDLAKFFEKDSAMIFSSSYDANGCLFETIFNDQDFIFCDVYSHPGIIDGVQKTNAKTIYYRRNDMPDLEDQLKRSPRARFRVIVAEAIYSIDGQIPDLKRLCELAKTYDALVILHESHGLGVLGANGKGCAEYTETLEEVDLITGSFGYGFGGIELGFIAGKSSIVEWLKQNARPYVFSYSPSPMIAAAARKVLELVPTYEKQRKDLIGRSTDLRIRLNKLGFKTVNSPHALIAVMTHDAVKTQKLVDGLFDMGVFCLGLCYPVVPKGFARIRLQLNSDHSDRDVAQITKAFDTVGQKLKMIKV